MKILRVVDFETTGAAPPSHVIEVGICDLTEDGALWRVDLPDARMFGGGTITAETRAVHHISPAEILGLDPFEPQTFVEQARKAGVTALVAHNAHFEEGWLAPVLGGLPIICTYKAALRVWPDAPNHQNGTLRYWLKEQGRAEVDRDLARPPHRAGPDAYVTAHVLKVLLEHATVDNLIAWTKEPTAFPRCPIGKWRGKPWADVEAGFLSWMLRTPDMDADLKWNAQRELARRAL